MSFNQPIQEIIRARYSCRSYRQQPLDPGIQARLEDLLVAEASGPFGTHPRFRLVAATRQDPQALRNLGTYGFIKGAPAFIISATRDTPGSLEDLGYLLEHLVLHATDLGLGTCWLGGTFTQSSFAQRIHAQAGEQVPIVLSVGYPAKQPRAIDGVIRRAVGAHRRQPWEDLFFDSDFAQPLKPEAARDYAMPLEMVRLAPSASNRQPWRVVRTGSRWHFFTRRSRVGKLRGGPGLLPSADLKRVDLGIAMCHFELGVRGLGLTGRWEQRQPQVPGSSEMDYTATWSASLSDSPRPECGPTD